LGRDKSLTFSSHPNLIVHADWGSAPGKRWLARAKLDGDGRYLASAPEPVGEPGGLLSRLRAQADDGTAILVGFDFPIGLPLAYAQQAGISDFLAVLPLLGHEQWSQFYKPASSPTEIGIYRPFYPSRAGNARQQHLIEGLRLTSIDDLRRLCERAQAQRRAACPLFWTLGAQQVGKAAISGWRDAIVGANGIPGYVAIWPFSGILAELLTPGKVVVAETYPAEFYAHLGVGFSAHRRGQKSGKRSQRDRLDNAGILLDWTDRVGVAVAPELVAALRDGFGASPDGEDRFDAVVGLFGMINVILGNRPVGEPEAETIRKIEGWILGQ
jgi:hypothetical protein